MSFSSADSSSPVDSLASTIADQLQIEPGSNVPAAGPGGAAEAPLPTLSPVGLSVVSSRLFDQQLVSVNLLPPAPSDDIVARYRVPADLVCSIDVSGSMDTHVVMKDENGNAESFGLTTLDLVKHSLRTIIHSLEPADRLALVTFSNTAQIKLPLTPVDENGKQELLAAVDSLHTEGSTNLFDGVMKALQVVRESAANKTDEQTRNSVVFVLSDGIPNIDPPRGIIPELQHQLTKNPIHCPVYTFGFGYELQADTMEQIAQSCRGAFSFIPDGGMVGTVFVSALSNAACSIASEVDVTIQGSGLKVSRELVRPHQLSVTGPSQITILCDPLRFGQEKNFVFPVSLGEGASIQSPPSLTATVRFKNLQSGELITLTETIHLPNLVEQAQIEGAGAEGQPNEATNESNPFDLAGSTGTDSAPAPRQDRLEAECALIIHYARLNAVNLIRALLDKNQQCQVAQEQIDQFVNGMNTAWLPAVKQREAKLRAAAGIPEPEENNEEDSSLNASAGQLDYTRVYTRVLTSLLADITGQVTEASTKLAYFNRWGKYYLRSLSRAHLQQCSNNFKDPGIQVYGGALFNQLREKMNDIFIALPPPQPSRQAYSYASNNAAGAAPAKFSMSRFHNAAYGCFAPETRILMADGNEKMAKFVRSGDRVRTGNGSQATVTIAAEFGCEGDRARLATLKELNDLSLTAYHPIRIDGEWKFPISLIDPNAVNDANLPAVYCPAVYNFVLDSHHSLIVNGIEACTLGHSFRDNSVINHPYFGSQRVVDDLKRFDQTGNGNISIAAGQAIWARNSATGLIDSLQAVNTSDALAQKRVRLSHCNPIELASTLLE